MGASARMDDSLDAVVGAKTAKALREGLGLETVADLIGYYPRRYVETTHLSDLGELAVGEHVTVVAEIVSATSRPLRKGPGSMVEVVVTDGRGRLSAVFFRQPWRVKQCRPGRRGLFSGVVSSFGGTRQLAHPRIVVFPDDAELAGAGEEAGPEASREAAEARALLMRRLIPIYPATAAVPSWRIGAAIGLALDALGDVADPLPEPVRASRDLMDLRSALEIVHRPIDREQVDRARDRLRFDEAFGLQLVLALRRQSIRGMAAVPRRSRPGGLRDALDDRLPFGLTHAQRRVGDEIDRDLAAAHPMHRLLQGDVGSGKTLVALRAMLTVVDAGGQAALLAPTEVLAQQHARTLRDLLGPLGERGRLGGADDATRVTLVTGSLGARARREALLEAASGEAGIVVGTHALLEERVSFADLGLVVVDEQHRFGVEQRAILAERGAEGHRPHVLVMTATPIPRTVAMTVFGDLDVSVLDERPPGRGAVATHVVAPRERPAHLARAWERIREEVVAGRKAYVVCPRIGSDDEDGDFDRDADRDADGDGAGPGARGDDPVAEEPGSGRSAVLETAEQLREGLLPGLRIGVMHGRLPAEEKEEAMRRFAAPVDDPDAIDVLVATTVVEVGVDVPQATVMMILDAERFGMSQLHQLRGRIGRGSDPGLCLLVTGAPADGPGRRRLDAVASTDDGFVLARFDLQERREGDVLGASQSGRSSSLRLLEVVRDEAVVVDARDAAEAVVEADPGLAAHPGLRAVVDRLEADARAEFLDKG